MNEVKDFLTKNDVQFFATQGLDGKPKVRPFQFMREEGGKYYFCTSNKKPVFEEIQKLPYVEICCASPDFEWLRLKGKVVFTGDLTLKQRILDASSLVQSIYKIPENPDFEVFYLDEAEGTIADFSGNPPKTFNL
ncbi:pyridoxamine 5'-phosphate oxidase family protein [Breznakiella homolactica]|uniref:Pyridoxamine 5'-phosphate oxidase family protein n=1 Tax=Breznakiella homolactica TaxID=2798577 RepID=A0A7T8BA45_9SPIR|nr:pyridoxamine 5'-phosphate oxidase family protein [Breznakiella homolactica]QQO09152.1 pyridoxamine 5'-phosphate oxidase family protein [Breznakiella homolactica]